MALDISTRVIVRVWASQENKAFPGNNVGHVSIETPDIYMSLWPVPFTQQQKDEYNRSGILKQKYLKYFMERSASFLQSYQDDYKAEGNIAPQVTISLYSLDYHMIENEFHNLKANTEGWRLIGSNLFVQTLEDTVGTMLSYSKILENKTEHKNIENCASLAVKILKAGGISHLVDLSTFSTFSSRTSSVIKPDDLLTILIPAKLAEEKDNPETAAFRLNNETQLVQPSKFCVLL